MQPPVMVPESMQLDTLMETLRQGGLQLAVVVDEFGFVDGIVTLEDLNEEIVGDVVDEHDDEPRRFFRSRTVRGSCRRCCARTKPAGSWGRCFPRVSSSRVSVA